MKFLWKVTKQTVTEFLGKGLFTRAAALSYYTIFSLPPILLIILYSTTLIYDEETIRQTIFGSIGDLIGQSSAEQLSKTVDAIGIFEKASWASAIGAAGLLISSTTVFVTIQDSLNRIFNVKEQPEGIGWWLLIRNRLLSFSLILGIAFILLVSLIINALLSALFRYLENFVPDISSVLIVAASLILPLLLTALLFALIFKFLPDIYLRWKDAFRGAAVTTVLFFIGMYGIEFYLGQSQAANLYEAAGSVLVILLWVFYASAIFLLGATFTAVYTEASGNEIEPSQYAVRFKQKVVEKEASKDETAE